jgi:hypothetical protein
VENAERRKSVKPAVIVQVPMHPGLKKLISQEARKVGVHRNVLIAQILGDKVGRPDLAVVPSAKRGRPPKVAV